MIFVVVTAVVVVTVVVVTVVTVVVVVAPKRVEASLTPRPVRLVRVW